MINSNFRNVWLFLAFSCASSIPSLLHAQGTGNLEGKVFSQLADYTLNRDQVMKQYCFMAQMETVTVRGKNPPIDHRWYYLRSGNVKPGFQYHSYARMPVDGESSTGQQYWVEYATNGKKYIAGSGSRDYRKYPTKEKEQKSVKEWLNYNGIHMLYFDPFDDLMDLAHFNLFQEVNVRSCEKVFINGAKLQSASETFAGILQSKWLWRDGDLDCEIVMDQSDAAGGMPTYIKFASTKNDRFPIRSETRIRWQKLDENCWVPMVINAVIFQDFKPGSERHYNSRLWWKVGDEVQDDFFDIESPDLRIPFMQTFGRQFDFTLEGAPNLGEPWVRPEDMDIIIKPTK